MHHLYAWGEPHTNGYLLYFEHMSCGCTSVACPAIYVADTKTPHWVVNGIWCTSESLPKGYKGIKKLKNNVIGLLGYQV